MYASVETKHLDGRCSPEGKLLLWHACPRARPPPRKRSACFDAGATTRSCFERSCPCCKDASLSNPVKALHGASFVGAVRHVLIQMPSRRRPLLVMTSIPALPAHQRACARQVEPHEGSQRQSRQVSAVSSSAAASWRRLGNAEMHACTEGSETCAIADHCRHVADQQISVHDAGFANSGCEGKAPSAAAHSLLWHVP